MSTHPIIQHRAAAKREADESLTVLAEAVGKRSVTTPELRYFGPSGGGWMALGRVKGHRQRHPWIRGHGQTARAALNDLNHQIDRFERGERDGEQ